jgi:DNA transposition AAA+ family ATPase
MNNIPFQVIEAATAGQGAWVSTRTAAEVTGALDLATMLGGVAVVVGPSGVGKSAAAQHYAEERTGCYLASLSAADRGMVPALARVAAAMGLGYYRQYGAKDLADVIRAELRSGALLIIDNAEHLPADVLILLGSFTERPGGAPGGGVALIGRERLHPVIFGGTRGNSRQDMDWLESRVAASLFVKGVPDADVAAFAETYGIRDLEACALLQKLANRPEAPNMLWVLTRVLRYAQAQAKDGAVRAAHVRKAAAALAQRVVE